MTNTTAAANALPVEPATPSKFAIAFTEWVEARTVLARLDAYGTATDEQHGQALDKEREAIWAVIRAPSEKDTYERRQRAMFVQTLFIDAADRGRPSDNHTMIALAGMVTEILR
jgi:hypothetical protein